MRTNHWPKHYALTQAPAWKRLHLALASLGRIFFTYALDVSDVLPEFGMVRESIGVPESDWHLFVLRKSAL
jgi:hypothetical protein